MRLKLTELARSTLAGSPGVPEMGRSVRGSEPPLGHKRGPPGK